MEEKLIFPLQWHQKSVTEDVTFELSPDRVETISEQHSRKNGQSM